jgi:hypothetical protein
LEENSKHFVMLNNQSMHLGRITIDTSSDGPL